MCHHFPKNLIEGASYDARVLGMVGSSSQATRESPHSLFWSVQGHRGTLEAIGLGRVGQLKASTKAMWDTTWLGSVHTNKWVSLQDPVWTVLASLDSPAGGRGPL